MVKIISQKRFMKIINIIKIIIIVKFSNYNSLVTQWKMKNIGKSHRNQVVIDFDNIYKFYQHFHGWKYQLALTLTKIVRKLFQILKQDHCPSRPTPYTNITEKSTVKKIGYAFYSQLSTFYNWLIGIKTTNIYQAILARQLKFSWHTKTQSDFRNLFHVSRSQVPKTTLRKEHK